MIFERTTRQQSLAEVRQALSEELGTHTPRLTDRAEMLESVAEDYGVTTEEIVQWIHFRTPEKRWSTAEFVRWCVSYSDARRELEKLWAEEKREWHKICPRCWGHLAERVGPRWICTHCGEVE